MRTLTAAALLFVSPTALAQNLVDLDTASLVFDYEWENIDTGAIAAGTVTFTFYTVVDNTLSSRCNNGWAANLCRVGTFETSDGGTGLVTFSVLGSSPSFRRQTVTLSYDVTDARYSGQVYVQPAQLWSGTMVLPSNSAWDGVFIENTMAPATLAPDAAFEDPWAPGSGQPDWAHGNGGRGNGRGRN